MLRDLKSNVDLPLALPPAARVNGTATGNNIDLQGYGSAEVAFAFGAWTDGTHAPALQESTDGTTFTAVGTADQQGTLANVVGTAGQNVTQRVGYIGQLRFIRPMVVTTGATTGAVIGAVAARGRASVAPLA